MKLYGVPIAVIPNEEGPTRYDVICTPIAVSIDNTQAFEILSDKKLSQLRMQFDLNDPNSMMECFIRLVSVIEEAVRRQKEGLNEYQIPEFYPVVLHIGQDSRKPVNLDAIYMLLFGERFHSETYGDETYEAAVSEAARVRSSFHITDPQLRSAYERLSVLLNPSSPSCTIQKGSYVPGHNHLPDEPEPLDTELRELKLGWNNGANKEAHQKIIELAAQEGKVFAQIAFRYPEAFEYKAPRGYEDNPILQEKFPSFAFFHWHPDFENSFHRAFEQHYAGQYPKRMKLPLDPDSPPFTHPCANGIRAQWEILLEERNPNDIIDHTETKWRISEASRRIAQHGEHREHP